MGTMERLESLQVNNPHRVYFDEVIVPNNKTISYAFPKKGGVFANAFLSFVGYSTRDGFHLIQHNFYRDEPTQQAGYFEDIEGMIANLYRSGVIPSFAPGSYRLVPLHLSERQNVGTELSFYITPRGFLEYEISLRHLRNDVRVFTPLFFTKCSNLAIFVHKRVNGEDVKYNFAVILRGGEVMLDEELLDEIKAGL